MYYLGGTLYFVCGLYAADGGDLREGADAVRQPQPPKHCDNLRVPQTIPNQNTEHL